MQTRIAASTGLLWLPALALLLAACGVSQTVVAPAASSTSAPAIASPAAPTATAVPPTGTAAPTLAPATASPAALAATVTAPVASVEPAGPTATATPDPAVTTVLAYLDARVRTDVAAATGLSCKAWKSKAVTEVTSFRSMNAKLVGVTCQLNGSAGSFTLVGCGGKMVTTYGTETKDWDLSTFVYQVTAEDGQWKMCGYH